MSEQDGAGSAPPESEDDLIQRLHRFYETGTLAELVLVQARHIEKLQAGLPSLRDEFPRTPREG